MARGRKKEPDGRRVTVCAKVSEATAAAIEVARGGTSASEWIAAAIAAKLAPAPVQRSHAARIEPPPSMPPADPPPRPRKRPGTPAASPQPRRCNHPGKRIVGGYCPSCDHIIEPGGIWRET